MVNLSQTGDGTFMLHFEGDFTFNSHNHFRIAIKDALHQQASSLNISLKGVKYIDSSALGMLLLAMEECKAKNCKMSVTEASGYVADVLNMVMLEKLVDRAQA